MRKLNVRHERLPNVGERFELDTASGLVPGAPIELTTTPGK